MAKYLNMAASAAVYIVTLPYLIVSESFATTPEEKIKPKGVKKQAKDAIKAFKKYKTSHLSKKELRALIAAVAARTGGKDVSKDISELRGIKKNITSWYYKK